jgi:tetratricopeptide (TPR) repeat protein
MKCPECGTIPAPADRARAALNDLLLMPRDQRTSNEFKEAARVCTIILRDSSDAKELNLAAWVLAAARHSPFNDPPTALKLAQRACELTNFEQASCLDTLGVCYAACGQFDAAIRYVEMAMQRCNGAERIGCERRLELFREGKFYLE